jgi:hypothetical protein
MGRSLIQYIHMYTLPAKQMADSSRFLLSNENFVKESGKESERIYTFLCRKNPYFVIQSFFLLWLIRGRYYETVSHNMPIGVVGMCYYALLWALLP